MSNNSWLHHFPHPLTATVDGQHYVLIDDAQAEIDRLRALLVPDIVRDVYIEIDPPPIDRGARELG